MLKLRNYKILTLIGCLGFSILLNQAFALPIARGDSLPVGNTKAIAIHQNANDLSAEIMLESGVQLA
ncbi:MAG TPA: hypothetical protein VFC73_05600 [Syntrophomonadaceae bacterium]|nr:hypothetical protein [Syntrophomonadaceae bacterium]